MFYGSLTGFGGGSPAAAPEGFYEDIVDASLDTNLQFCLDAAAASSYTSGQTWTDMTGQGNDFYRGATASATTDDPTHNGTPGALSSNEYFSFDGGDYFRLTQSNPSWVNDMHKNNAAWSWILWVYTANVGATMSYMGSTVTGGENPGLHHYSNNIEKQIIEVGAGPSNALSPGTHATAFNIGAWNMLGISINEATGSSGGFFYLNGVETLFTSTYSSPSTSAASHTLSIGSSGGGATPLENTFRVGGAMMWSGTALSAANFDTLWTAQKGRYGL